MLHESTQQLIRKLVELTDAGALAWKEGEDGAFRLETEGYVVEVLGEPARLRLLRGDGRELERADEADLAAVPWPERGGTYAAGVAGMAARAGRIARGTEQAIAKVLSSLSAPPRASGSSSLPGPGAMVAAFGSIESFARSAAPPPAPQAAPAASPNLLAQGISARSIQTVESASREDVQHALAATTTARQPEPASRLPPSGADIYKPWS